jgi:hypothetical protein
MYILNISESYTTPLDEIVAGMRNAKLKAAKRVKYIRMLWLRKERDWYIPEIIALLTDPNLSGIAVYYLYVCAQSPGNEVYHYLKPEHLANLKCKSMFLPDNPANYVQDLKRPILLQKYVLGEDCACDICGKPTKNIIIKIEPVENLISSTRKGSYIYNKVSYSGKENIHVICDDCVLEEKKRKRGKDKSDAQLIDEYLHTNQLISLTALDGYNYEYLLDPLNLIKNGATDPKYNGMVKYAQELKTMIDALKNGGTYTEV